MTEAALTITQPSALQTPDRLLELAVNKGADVNALEKLLDLRERFEREEARKAYFAAKARFQALAPTIKKDKEADTGRFKYAYATLSGIATQIREALESCGLSYRWNIDDKGDDISVTCILSHESGHSEHNSMTAPADDSGAKNAIQQRGSTVTYLQRYTLIGVLGLSSANDDDDGRSAGISNVERLRDHNAAVREHFHSVAAIKVALACEDYDAAYEAYTEVPKEAIGAMNLAPTKGGIWTTAEIAKFKSNEWSAARQRFADALDQQAQTD